MLQKQQNRLSMNKAVIDTLDGQPALWQDIPAFVIAHDQLRTSITGRDAAAGTQAAPTTGVTQDKEADITDAVDKVMVLAGNTAAYGMEVKNHDLVASLSFGRSYLLHLPDNEVYAVLNNMLTRVVDNADNTGDYNVTQAAIAAASVAVDKVRFSHTAPRRAIDGQAAATKSIPVLEADGRHALAKLDRLMRNYAQSQPGFYRQYRQARIIVDSGGRHDGDGGGSTPQ